MLKYIFSSKCLKTTDSQELFFFSTYTYTGTYDPDGIHKKLRDENWHKLLTLRQLLHWWQLCNQRCSRYSPWCQTRWKPNQTLFLHLFSPAATSWGLGPKFSWARISKRWKSLGMEWKESIPSLARRYDNPSLGMDWKESIPTAYVAWRAVRYVK